MVAILKIKMGGISKWVIITEIVSLKSLVSQTYVFGTIFNLLQCSHVNIYEQMY